MNVWHLHIIIKWWSIINRIDSPNYGVVYFSRTGPQVNFASSVIGKMKIDPNFAFKYDILPTDYLNNNNS